LQCENILKIKPGEGFEGLRNDLGERRFMKKDIVQLEWR
jgi:hypothetical protein